MNVKMIGVFFWVWFFFTSCVLWLVMGLSLQLPFHVNISSAFLLAEITHMVMSLQDQAYTKAEHDGRQHPEPCYLFVVVALLLCACSV